MADDNIVVQKTFLYTILECDLFMDDIWIIESVNPI